jgi:hypothetical protein
MAGTFLSMPTARHPRDAHHAVRSSAGPSLSGAWRCPVPTSKEDQVVSFDRVDGTLVIGTSSAAARDACPSEASRPSRRAASAASCPQDHQPLKQRNYTRVTNYPQAVHSHLARSLAAAIHMARPGPRRRGAVTSAASPTRSRDRGARTGDRQPGARAGTRRPNHCYLTHERRPGTATLVDVTRAFRRSSRMGACGALALVMNRSWARGAWPQITHRHTRFESRPGLKIVDVAVGRRPRELLRPLGLRRDGRL